MKNNTLLPADTYIVLNKTILTEVDKDNLLSLYGPIIGPLAVNLYLVLWRDLGFLELQSIDYSHHHLMTVLQSDLASIKKARESLESFGLLKTYIKQNEINEYIYELYSPLSSYEFFNHPVFNIILFNNIGKVEYDILKKCYENINFSLKDYNDISVNIKDIYKSIPMCDVVNDDMRSRNIINTTALDIVDFDFIISSIPEHVINEKAFNKKTRELINNIAFLYNLDNLKVCELIRSVVEDKGFIDKEELRKTARKYYQYNNSGSLPTLIYRTQPDYLKSPDGDTSKRGKILYVFENTSPYDFLKSKYKGGNPTSKDLKLLEMLVIDLNLKPAVVNVLIDYVLKINNNKLNSAFVEVIAGQWKRSGVETAEEAMQLAEKEHNKKTKKVKEEKEKIKTPVWFDEKYEKEDISEDERNELVDLLKDFR